MAPLARGLHPHTQGKIGRWHQTLKNRILMENYFLPGDLETQIEAFVERYHESLKNVTPAETPTSAGLPPSSSAMKPSNEAIEHRRLLHRKLAA